MGKASRHDIVGQCTFLTSHRHLVRCSVPGWVDPSLPSATCRHERQCAGSWRSEVVASGLPLWHGSQLALDSTRSDTVRPGKAVHWTLVMRMPLSRCSASRRRHQSGRADASYHLQKIWEDWVLPRYLSDTFAIPSRYPKSQYQSHGTVPNLQKQL